jgi:hypothetical protein
MFFPILPKFHQWRLKRMKMDKETAKKVLEIMLTADGGCEFCVRDLFLKFIKEFPEYSYLARKMYRKPLTKSLSQKT